jgi:hypothetical protein
MISKLFILLLTLSVLGSFGGEPLLWASEAAEHPAEEGQHHHSGDGLKHGTIGPHHHDEEHHHGHKAYHHGVLCVLENCEVGHIETLLDGDTLEAWFVGGGHDTDRSVRVKAKEIPLKVRVHGQGEKTLVLMAAPMKLAGEKIGDASRFIATADWLSGVEEFEAEGEVVFKGVRRKIIIRYPQGYDPGHGHPDHGHGDHDHDTQERHRGHEDHH